MKGIRLIIGSVPSTSSYSILSETTTEVLRTVVALSIHRPFGKYSGFRIRNARNGRMEDLSVASHPKRLFVIITVRRGTFSWWNSGCIRRTVLHVRIIRLTAVGYQPMYAIKPNEMLRANRSFEPRENLDSLYDDVQL